MHRKIWKTGRKNSTGCYETFIFLKCSAFFLNDELPGIHKDKLLHYSLPVLRT